jgi:hypothetical protein
VNERDSERENEIELNMDAKRAQGEHRESSTVSLIKAESCKSVGTGIRAVLYI